MSEILTTVYLPSKGKMNSDSVYAGPIELDMMGFEQEKLIYGSSSSNVLDKMLKSVIKTPGIEVSELVAQDKHFLLVKERIHSYGNRYHLEDVCPNCGKEEEHVVDLDLVPILEIPDDFVEPIMGVLPRSGEEIGVRLLRQSDRKAMEAEIKMKSEKLGMDPQGLEYEQRLVRSIQTIQGVSVSSIEKTDFVRGLKGMDLAYINHLLNSVQFGYSNTVTVTCSACETQYESPFILTSEFFRPRFD